MYRLVSRTSVVMPIGLEWMGKATNSAQARVSNEALSPLQSLSPRVCRVSSDGLMRDLTRSVLFVAIVGLMWGCGSGGGSSTPAAPTPPTPTVTSVTVTGPSGSAKPGESAQFTATAALSNGTSQTVTNQATWQSSNVGVATISSTGLATASGAGDADIRATYQGVPGTAHITVTAPPAPPAPPPT